MILLNSFYAQYEYIAEYFALLINLQGFQGAFALNMKGTVSNLLDFIVI